MENSTIKFPNKHVLDKIVEYINFDSSNRYTLVFSNYANISRPGTRGSHRSASSSHKSSASMNKLSKLSNPKLHDGVQDDANSLVARQINPSERRSAKSSFQLADNSATEFNESLLGTNANNTTEIIDQVLTKVPILRSSSRPFVRE